MTPDPAATHPPHQPDAPPPVDPPLDLEQHPLVFFDGVCGLCNTSVDFFLKRDKARRFRFATLQGELADRLLADAFNGPPPDSLILLDNDGVHTRSTGVLRILAGLPAPWSWLAIFRFVPAPLRDAVYRFVAAHRYRVFGKKDACRIPTPDERDRIIG